jgi:hypothetical protein
VAEAIERRAYWSAFATTRTQGWARRGQTHRVPDELQYLALMVTCLMVTRPLEFVFAARV